jgi:hypothetical protein
VPGILVTVEIQLKIKAFAHLQGNVGEEEKVKNLAKEQKQLDRKKRSLKEISQAYCQRQNACLINEIK